MKKKILIIDDDPSVLSSFQLYLQDSNLELVLCSSGDEGIDQFKITPEDFVCAFVDYQLTDEFGDQEAVGHKITEALKEIDPSLYVIMMSGDESKEALESWLKAGVDKFIYKPMGEKTVSTLVQYAEDLFSEKFPHHGERLINENGMVGISKRIKQVCKLAKKFAPSDETVLVLGETGTGKELIARSLHDRSPRKQKAFVAVNCAAIAESIFESELFGHVKGAFTGASSDKLGKFREADGGTLFLDEIHHLSLNQQAKILRVIQEKVVTPVGGKAEHKVDFRLVCASKPNLRKLSEKNEFLIDLFFRISALNIQVEPLRKRPEDIEVLVRHFQTEQEEKLGRYKRLSPSAMSKLKDYPWPGNVRELRKLVTELYYTVDTGLIKPTDLPESILKKTMSVDLKDGMTMADLEENQRQQKRALIKSTMAKAGNNKSKAAEILNMKRSTFIWHLKDLGIYELFEKRNLVGA